MYEIHILNRRCRCTDLREKSALVKDTEDGRRLRESLQNFDFGETLHTYRREKKQ